MTVRPYSIVNHIIYDKDTKKAKGVMVIDAETKVSSFMPKLFCKRIYARINLLLNSTEADTSGPIRS
jgi:hypothetical protein